MPKESAREASAERLEDYLVRHDVALVKAEFFKECLRKSKEDDDLKALPRRQEIPRHQLVAGIHLRGTWTDPWRPPRSLFVVSHAWLSFEHPDPSGVRLEALVEELEWFRANDGDLVFFDYCSLFQTDRLHPEFSEDLPEGHAALQTPAQFKLYHGALRYIDELFSSPIAKVIVMPEIYDMSTTKKRRGMRTHPNYLRYIQRGWSGTEFSIASRAGRVVGSARPLEGISRVRDDDLDYIEDIDYKELQVHVQELGEASGCYRQRKNFEGAPYFEQVGGKHLFMYRKYEERWYISPELGSADSTKIWAQIEVADEREPPLQHWKVTDMEHPTVDVQMRPPDFNSVSVEGFHWFRVSGNGIYTERGVQNGRPYYQNEDGIFVYMLKNEEWCIGPVLGAFGDLVWASFVLGMNKPPNGKWPARALKCPDVQVTRVSATTFGVSNFGWTRGRANCEFKPAGIHEGCQCYTSDDGALFMYRWREQRWRIATVLGATGSHVTDQVICDELEPPAGSWTKATVIVEEVGDRSLVTLTGTRTGEIPGKARIFVTTDGEEWQEVCNEVHPGTHNLAAPAVARRASVVLEKALTWVKCTRENGIAYRRSMDLEDRIEEIAGPSYGHRVAVKDRVGDWVQCEKGFLPLYLDEERVFEGGSDLPEEPFFCRLVGYRPDPVETTALAGDEDSEEPLLGVQSEGLSPDQFRSVYDRGAARFMQEEDREVVLAMYRRNCLPDAAAQRLELLETLVSNKGRGAAQHIVAVREALGDADGRVVVAACGVMAELGGKLWSKDLEVLAELLSSRDGLVREAAARALGKSGEASAKHLDALVELLVDPDLHVQAAAAGAVAWLGPTAADSAEYGAVPLLVELLPHIDKQVRAAAVTSLCSMGPYGSPHAETVVKSIADACLNVRIAAVRGLAVLGEAGAAHAQALVPLLDDPHLRHVAIESLFRLECHQAEIAALLDSPHWYVRRDAIAGIAAVGPPAASGLTSPVAARLADQHRDVRLQAVAALASFGASAAGQLEDLQRVVDNVAEEPEVRNMAQLALEAVQQAAASASN